MKRIRVALASALSFGLLSLTLPAAAATRPAKSGTPDSLQVLARIGRETITRADVQRRLEELPEQVRGNYTTPEGKKQLLDRIVEEKVWMQKAIKAGVPTRPEVVKQLEQARRDLLIRTYLNDVMAKNAAPDDAELRAYYDAHVSEYRIPATATVRHIQSKTQADARRVLGYARAGQDFLKLAQKHSTDSLTRTNGGFVGTVTRDGSFGSLGSQPAMAESAFALGVNKVGGPYRTDHGWHVIKLDNLNAESVRSFDQMKAVIQRQIGSQKAQDFYKVRLEEARKELKVTPDSSAIKNFLSAKKGARDLFQEAQQGGSPESRIGKYQALLAEYPDSDVSPQAQFMIGFIYSEELRKYEEAEKAFRSLLARYPKSELVPSAQWMVDHMRSEDAPSFFNLEADSTKSTGKPGRKGTSHQP